MSELLFKLRNVPEDEAADVRELLRNNAIEFYETRVGNWGISMPAIWLQNNHQLAQARQLLKTYQKKRQQDAQSAYQEAFTKGEQRTVWTLIGESPLRFVLLIMALLFVLYISLMPFLRL